MTEQAQQTPAAGTPAAGTPAAEQPLIMGKFKTQDDLVKAYGELEKRLGSGGTPTEQPKADPLNPPATPGKDGLSIDKPAAPAAGAALEAAYEKSLTVQLSDADYAALEKQGFARSTVDTFVSGRNAAFDIQRNEVVSIVGTKDDYASMVRWAAGNLSAGEIAAYNNAMNSRDSNAMKLAVRGLAAAFRGQVGKEPGTLEGGKPAFSGVAPFKDRAEFYKAAGSADYRNNAAVREEVQKRLQASMAANPRF